MRRVLPALLVASGAFAEQGLAVRASLREDRRALHVEVDAGSVPAGALQIQLLRDVSTLRSRDGIPVLEMALPPESLHGGDSVLELGDVLAPGCYRLRVQSQGSNASEILLQEDLLTPSYIEAVKKSEVRMADALREVGDLLDRMAEMEARCASDQAKGYEAWKAWHPEATQKLKALAARGHDPLDPFFPEIRELLLENLVQRGLLVMELRKLQAARTGRAWDRGGALKDHETFTRKGLESFDALLKQESLWYRLTVLKACVRAVSLEAARRPPRAAWDSRRKSWERLLEAWKASLDPARVPAEALESLAKAWESWVDAQQGALFDSGSSEAVEARKRALEEGYAALEARVRSGS